LAAKLGVKLDNGHRQVLSDGTNTDSHQHVLDKTDSITQRFVITTFSWSLKAVSEKMWTLMHFSIVDSLTGVLCLSFLWKVCGTVI